MDRRRGHFSGFVGGESYRKVSLMRERHPEFIVKHAVKGMLPQNRIAAKMLTKLRDGASLAAACAAVPANQADQVQSWFANWTNLGWFCRRK